jgi:hypothetical protein
MQDGIQMQMMPNLLKEPTVTMNSIWWLQSERKTVGK